MHVSFPAPARSRRSPPGAPLPALPSRRLLQTYKRGSQLAGLGGHIPVAFCFDLSQRVKKLYVRPRINVIGYFLCFVCFVVVFRLFDCFVFSLDVCCRCTVLFYVCIYVHVLVIILLLLLI